MSLKALTYIIRTDASVYLKMLLPVVSICRVDGHGVDSDVLSLFNLIPHQRDERRHDDNQSILAVLSQQSGRQEVQDTLPPSRSLDDQQPLAAVYNGIDRFPLVFSEISRLWANCPLQQFPCLLSALPTRTVRYDTIRKKSLTWTQNKAEWWA